MARSSFPSRLAAYALCFGLLSYGGAAGQTGTRAPNTLAARALACANCRGKQGEGTQDVYFPRLAGKPAGYLYNQLEAFRAGWRKYPPVNYLLKFQRSDFLRDLAEYFAAQRPVSAAMIQAG